jgi:hypothetical protein
MQRICCTVEGAHLADLNLPIAGVQANRRMAQIGAVKGGFRRLDSVLVKRATANRNLVIDINPAFPFQMTALDGIADLNLPIAGVQANRRMAQIGAVKGGFRRVKAGFAPGGTGKRAAKLGLACAAAERQQ